MVSEHGDDADGQVGVAKLEPKLPLMNQLGHYVLVPGNERNWITDTRLLMSLDLRTKSVMRFAEQALSGISQSGDSTAGASGDSGGSRTVVKEHDEHVRSLMLLSMPTAQRETYSRYPTASELWCGMHKMHLAHSKANKLAYMDNMQKLSMLPKERVSTYIDRSLALRERLRGVGAVLSDDDLILHILNGLHSHFGLVKMSLRMMTDVDLEKMTAILIQEEHTAIATVGSASLGSAHYVAPGNAIRRDNNGRNGGAPHRSTNVGGSSGGDPRRLNGGAGGSASSGFNRFGPSSGNSSGGDSKSRVECFGCREMGHYRSECPNESRWQASDHEFGSGGRDAPTGRDAPPTRGNLHCMARLSTAATVYAPVEPPVEPLVESPAIDTRDPTEWVIDTGATGHVSHSRALLHNYRPVLSATMINTADNTAGGSLNVEGFGTAFIDSPVHGVIKRLVLHDVAHAPSAAVNLLSGTRCNEAGATVICAPGHAAIEFLGTTVAYTTMQSHGLWHLLSSYSPVGYHSAGSVTVVGDHSDSVNSGADSDDDPPGLVDSSDDDDSESPQMRRSSAPSPPPVPLPPVLLLPVPLPPVPSCNLVQH
jgi:hypothetical protein